MTKTLSEIRKDFPVLSQKVHEKPLIYLDNAATTLKPRSVIDAVSSFYESNSANIHRGVHLLSEQATALYEGTREYVAKFLNAKHTHEVIFTKGTTESINLVASSLSKKYLSSQDEIVITAMEHHSNIVPWQMACEASGAKLKVIPMNQRGELDLDKAKEIISPKTKILSFVYISNSLGTINPAKELIKLARANNALVLIDGAQTVSHQPVDVQDLDCDFFAFSGHKIFGPTGVGVLYGKEAVLNDLPPYQGGGDMIESVSFEKTTYAPLPAKFEAGTPPIASVIGLKTALQYVKEEVGFEFIQNQEHELLVYAQNTLGNLDGLKPIGTAEHKTSVFSFILDRVHPHDVGTFLDQDGVAVRTGHHCTQPVMTFFQIPATTRASFSFYNTVEEVDILAASLKKIQEFFQ